MKTVCGFIRFIALFGRYSLSGIEAVIAPALRRMNIDQHSSNDKELAGAIGTTIKQLRRNPNVKQKGSGKPPLCSFDVQELVSRIPDTLPSKLSEASLFLFAHHTGSRALTCENILVKDIEQIELDDSGLAAVVINLRVTKGNANWNHPVVIEGFINRKHPLDVVYYLNQHVLNKFQMDLKQITDRVEGQQRSVDEKRVWSLSREAMRERLKTRLAQTGFPPVFAFHSFRSGFLCSALMTAGANPDHKTAILETTGIVAGWQVYGKAQRRYIKTVAERTIVASRLLNLGIGLPEFYPSQEETPSVTLQSSTTTSADPSTAVPRDPADPDSNPSETRFRTAVPQHQSHSYIRTPKSTEEFHGFKLKPPKFSSEIFRRALRRVFNEPFLRSQAETVRQLQHANNCFNAVLVKWGKQEFSKQQRKSATYNEWRLTGSRILDDHLMKEQQDPKQLAEIMLSKPPIMVRISTCQVRIHVKLKLTISSLKWELL